VKRRHFLLSAAIASWPLALLAQPRVARIGVLFPEPLAATKSLVEALKSGLRDLGYIEGSNIVFELRSAEGRYASLRALAEELVAAKVQLIVAFGTPPSLAAKAATSTIPVVMAAVGDPLGTGLVSSLARPGGNLTGTSNLSPPLVVKRLELVKECHPDLRRVGLLVNPSKPAQAASVRAVVEASRPLRLGLAQ